MLRVGVNVFLNAFNFFFGIVLVNFNNYLKVC